MKVALVALFSGIALLLCCGNLAAQQPGSAAYNSVYLPAHGVGDTARGSGAVRWGAMAAGKGAVLGWTTDAGSEEEATRDALDACKATGAIECEIFGTFANSCAVVATDIAHVDVASGQLVSVNMTMGISNLRKLRKRALKLCGDDCSIMREVCAFP